MTIRSDYMVGKTDTEPYYPVAVQNVDSLAMLTFQWAFGGNPYKVKVYNRSTGLREVLTLVGTNAVMRQGDYEWELLPSRDGFVLRVPGSDNMCLNQYGGNSGPLRYWDDPRSLTNIGSLFRVMEAPDPDGIATIEHSASNISHAVYDLSGRRVNSQLKKGIYIINGRKVAIK